MERLDSRVRAVWFVGALVTAAVLGAGAWLLDAFVVALPGWLAPAVGVAVALLGVAHALLRYRFWRFEVEEDALFIERGVFTRVRTVAPFVRVQHVDSRRGPVERLAGLGTVVVYTAGSRGADVAIPGLTPKRAEALREELRRLAIESEGASEDAV
jgi:membrane protein YdbS with pleckstrin-like domain